MPPLRYRRGPLCLKVAMNEESRKPVKVAVGHIVMGNLDWPAKVCPPLITTVGEFRQPFVDISAFQVITLPFLAAFYIFQCGSYV
jgi:hypothetical protein